MPNSYPAIGYPLAEKIYLAHVKNSLQRRLSKGEDLFEAVAVMIITAWKAGCDSGSEQ